MIFAADAFISPLKLPITRLKVPIDVINSAIAKIGIRIFSLTNLYGESIKVFLESTFIEMFSQSRSPPLSSIPAQKLVSYTESGGN
jgi:hypothetical protein